MDTKLNSIRVDGIKDKIHDRNEKFPRNNKWILWFVLYSFPFLYENENIFLVYLML